VLGRSSVQWRQSFQQTGAAALAFLLKDGRCRCRLAPPLSHLPARDHAHEETHWRRKSLALPGTWHSRRIPVQHDCRAVQREAMSQSCMIRGTWAWDNRLFLNFEMRYPVIPASCNFTSNHGPLRSKMAPSRQNEAGKHAAAQYFTRGPGAVSVARLPGPLMHAGRTHSHARGTNITSEVRKRLSSPRQAHAALVHARAPN
jgi:hypothetical protein